MNERFGKSYNTGKGVIVKYMIRAIFVLFFFQFASAEYTVHILNPWREDSVATRRDSLRIVGNAEVGYHPGISMVPEGGGWFLYTYKKSLKTDKVSFKITTWIGPESWRGRVVYGRTLRVDSLFAKVSPTAEDIWVVLNPDTLKFPTVYEIPPNGKTINLFNPWPQNSPKIIISGGLAVQMRVREDLCGWYRYYVAGFADSLYDVIFTDYFQTQNYTMSGLTNDAGIDLRAILKNNDTVYILPRPFPAGPPSLTSSFPGRLGDCNTRKVSGIFRDWKLDNVSFFNTPIGASSGHKGMVRPTLTAPDYKPRLTDNPSANTLNSAKLETWFQTVTFPDGTTNDTCIDLIMVKGYDGRWAFDSDKMGGFFPLDNFDNPNNIKYLDRVNPNDPTGTLHNFHFSMEMHLQFMYREGQKLQFTFQGDDDVWIFINNRLAIDLGGLQNRARDTLWIDKKKNELQIVDGKIYNMDIFFAERNPVGSNLIIQTTMDLRNSSELYYKESVTGPGVIQYDIWQQVQTQSNDCGLTRLTDGEELSMVDFYIEGPHFDSTTVLPPSLHYGGIMVDQNKSRVTIDSSKITGLVPGDYRLTYVSTFDKNRSGYLTFTVYPIPDHLDCIPDSVSLDLKRDVPIDSVVMREEQDSLSLYTVIRDIYGTYIDDGKNLTWKSSNEKVLTVSSAGTSSPRAMVHKIDGGNAWVIVSADGLKPDSILIHAVEKPNWPLIAKAVMTDKNGDCIPDQLVITLSDTFKTGQVLTSVEIAYNNKRYTVSANACEIEGKRLSAHVDEISTVDSRPSGSATIVIDVAGTERRHSGQFTDGVGPALRAAELLEKADDEPEIVYLTFSEPIHWATLMGNQYLLIKAGTSDTITVGILIVKARINDSIVAIELMKSVNAPVPGDALRLLPKSRGGTISDLRENGPHDLNKAVEIHFRKGAAPIRSAWYKDTDANGVLDSVFVHFKRDVEKAELDTIIIKWGTRSYKIGPENYSKNGDSLFSAPLRGLVVAPDLVATSGEMDIYQTYKDLPGIIRFSDVADSASPVITQAKLLLGGYDDNGMKVSDTLRVTFSEYATSTQEQPFSLFSTTMPGTYRFNTVTLDIHGINCIFLISGTNPVVSPVQGDSIWINELAGIHDLTGTAQCNPSNRRVLLEIVQPPAFWMTRIGPNPLTLSKTPLKIKVLSKRKVDLSPYRARIALFDHTGNIVMDGVMPPVNDAFEYDWNGTNKRKRLVGTGTYVLLVTVYEGNTLVWSEKRKIGVKRDTQ